MYTIGEMKKKIVFVIVSVCVAFAGLTGCKVNSDPETAPSSPTNPYNLLDTMSKKPSNQKVSGEKGEYSIEMEPNEVKNLIGVFQGYLLAEGATQNIIKVQLIDITDEANPKILRTTTYYAGTSFVLRQYFPGTKAIAIRVANQADTQNTVRFKFQ